MRRDDGYIELQIGKVIIKENCQKVHGIEGAIEEAFRIIKEKYLNAMKFEINKGETFNLILNVNRKV